MRQTKSKSGDFSDLANDYSQHRPNYASSVLNALFGLLKKPKNELDFVDVGAGTGIWTRMVVEQGVKSAVAIEPNASMRNQGKNDSRNMPITWVSGRAEKTGLNTASCDWLTMASSLHWTDFDLAIAEFRRVIRAGGRLTALWNPRLIEVNPLLVEIESHLKVLGPGIERVSSGLSGITNSLTSKLWNSDGFDDVIYVEGRHVIEMSSSRYLGAWRSVNDVRVQLGPKKFADFLKFIEDRIAGLDVIEATYLTRAWSAKRTG